jgi:ribosomal small subunit protein bTHX
MGKGDKRTRKGKIFAKSYGNTRPRKEAAATTKTTKAKPTKKK